MEIIGQMKKQLVKEIMANYSIKVLAKLFWSEDGRWVEISSTKTITYTELTDHKIE
jgi:chemotaxis receptor (MCP) glutamine deamidase CheD